jgi:serpin B
LVPDAGKLAEFEKNLNASMLETIKTGMQGETVKLELPKFKIESSLGLADMLSSMGMTDIFIGGKADLSGINGARNLFVSAIVHKSYVNVDEKGTEAAAATAVVISKTSLPVNIISLKIDRPFLFLIQDKESGTILFLGRMANF